MSAPSLWRLDAAPTAFPSLAGELTVDVAVVGGGMTGVMAAHLLAERGSEVALLEAGTIGSGATGGSTGNLYVTVDRHLSAIAHKYDAATVGVVVRARRAAMDQIEGLVRRFSIDCDFERVPFWLLAADDEHAAQVLEEADVARTAGLDAHIVEAGLDRSVPWANARAGLRLDGQAQIDPLAFVRGLARAIASPRVHVYEHTKVVRWDEGDDECTVTLANGGVVRASQVMLATHSPIGVHFVHTLLGPYREYGVAVQLEPGAELPAAGIHWVVGAAHKVSVRPCRDARGRPNLMAIGEPHKVGQDADNVARVARLEGWLRERFPVAAVTARWGAQNFRPADGLPYIGRRKAGSRVFVATGFAADGLVWGTLGAMLAADDLHGIENVWAAPFALGRHHPLKAAGAFVKENANVALQYLKDLPFKVDVRHFADVPRGEGRTLSIHGRKYAAHRADDGTLQVVSAICTHLGCTVHFNRLESSWDCPCHGSRFGVDGKILDGPAIADLAPIATEVLDGALEREADAAAPADAPGHAPR